MPSEDPKVADDHKKQKKRGFVRREGFIKLRERLSEEQLAPHLATINDDSVRFVHNTIDRRTSSTPETGGLYFLDEDWSFFSGLPDGEKPLPKGVFAAAPMRELYVDAPAGSLGDIRRLLSALGDIGYGRDANLGRGRWTLESVENDAELETVRTGACFPCRTDQQSLKWTTFAAGSTPTTEGWDPR
jgi:CRISPR-associated protein Csm4